MGIFLGAEKRSVQQTFPERPIPPFPGADMFGSTPGQALRSNPDLAMTVSSVWACVSLLAGTVSSLTLEAFRRTNDVPAKITPPQLIQSPSPGMTQSQWLHMLMVSALLRGNAYGRISARDAYERPTQIDLMNPDHLDITVDSDTGNLTFKVKKNQQIIPTADVWHMPGLTMPGQKLGLSPIAYGAATIGLDIAAQKFGSDFLEGGGIPKAILTSDMAVTQEQAATLKSRLMSALRGREPIVLGNGVRYDMISVRPDESQFLATLQADIAQIARFFGVPPEMVGGSGGHSMTYANVEQRSLDFLTYSVAWWLKRIEDAVFPLLPQPQFVKFRVEDLLRTDVHTQAQVDMFYIAAKVKAPSEIRDRIGLPPMTEAQKSEVDMVPLGIGPLGRPKGLPGENDPALPHAPAGPNAPVPADDQQQLNPSLNSRPGEVEMTVTRKAIDA